MNLFTRLLDFVQSSASHRLTLAIIFWVFWPGLMFIVGAIFESRLVPPWEHQTRMFFPGDMMLGLIVVVLLTMHSRTRDAMSWSYHWWWWLICIVIMAFVASKVRADDVSHYPYDVTGSPTKWVHDIVGYFVFPTLFLGLGLPQLVLLFARPRSSTAIKDWIIILILAGIYIGCTIWDKYIERTAFDLRECHPGEWTPIWKKARPLDGPSY